MFFSPKYDSKNCWTKMGVSKSLLIITYKVLIRSILDYCPLQSLIINKRNLKRIESIQNKSLRVATRWPLNKSNRAMLKHYKVDSISTRHLNPCKKYIENAVKTNKIIEKEVSDYVASAPIQDGSYSNSRRLRKNPTILSKIIK